MSCIDDAAAGPARLEPASPAPSRRAVLRGAAGAGAAGIATATLLGGALPAAAGTRSAAARASSAPQAPAGGSEPVVVHVRDAAAGEMDVFRGTTCTRVRDQDLAARLVRASR